MILDQITKSELRIPKDRLVKVRILDIPMSTDAKGKQSVNYVTERYEIPEEMLLLRRNPDPANDTPRKEDIKKKKLTKIFVGVPYQNGTTQVTTLVKLIETIHELDLVKAHFDKFDRDDLYQRSENQKLLKKEADFTLKDKWGISLPVIGKTPDGKWIVLGLTNKHQSGKDLEISEYVDIVVSSEITDSIYKSQKEGNQIDIRLHTTGVGRSAFGERKEKTQGEISRNYGTQTGFDFQEALRNLDNLPRYQVMAGAMPDSSYFYFCTQDLATLNNVQKIIQEERDNLKARKEQKTEGNKTEDGIKKLVKPVSLLPQFSESEKICIIFCAEEPGNKTKIISSEVFLQVPLQYWRLANQYMVANNWQYKLQHYQKCAIAGPKSTQSPPSSYKLWTKLLTAIIHREKIHPEAYFRILSEFLKKHDSKSLESTFVARKYEEIGKIIRQANQLIELETSKEIYQMNAGDIEEQLNQTTRDKNMNKPEIQPFLDILGDKVKEGKLKTEKETITDILLNIQPQVPEKEFVLYAKGVIIGRILKKGLEKLHACGRKGVKIGRGTHPTKLRHTTLHKEALQLVDLYEGVKKNPSEILFNQEFLPLLFKNLQDSKKDTFNAGLIAGLQIFIK